MPGVSGIPRARPCVWSIVQIESARNADSTSAETRAPGRLTHRLTAPSTRPTSPNASGSAISGSASARAMADSISACTWRATAVRVPVTTWEPVVRGRARPVPRN